MTQLLARSSSVALTTSLILSTMLTACGGGGNNSGIDNGSSPTLTALKPSDIATTPPSQPASEEAGTSVDLQRLGAQAITRSNALAVSSLPTFTVAQLRSCPLGWYGDSPSLADLPCLHGQYNGKVYEERYTNGGSFRRFTGQQCTVSLRHDNTMTLRIGSVAFNYVNNETPTMMAAYTYYYANEGYPQTGEGDAISAFFSASRYVYKKDGSAEYQSFAFNAFEHESDGPGWFLDAQAHNRYTLTTPSGASQEYRYTVGCWADLKL